MNRCVRDIFNVVSAFSIIDRRKLEQLLGMETGYVADFNDGTFAEFMLEYGGVDISDERFLRRGESKANRLRSFFGVEGDERVGIMVRALVEYWRATQVAPSPGEVDLARECEEAAARLMGEARIEVHEEDARRLFGDGYRLFLSHSSHDRVRVAQLREELAVFGISAFVAHEDIEPDTEWQAEIEKALETMDGLVALHTPQFGESRWTDHEVGWALARGVPVLSARLGIDPYGFLGRRQAISAGWDDLAPQIFQRIVNTPRGFELFVTAMENCGSFDDGNELGRILPSIREVTEAQIDRVVRGFNTNGQLRGAHAFAGDRPGLHGPGLVHFLNRWSRRKFRQSNHGRIELM